MTRCNITRSSYKFRLGITVLLLVASLCVPAYSLIDGQTFKVESLEIAGVSGLENNIQYVYGRYIFIAPYAPSIELNENSKIDQLDNNRLLVVDTKKLDAAPRVIDLGNCFFPRTLQFDEKSGIVFVRGTEFVELPSGDIESYEVISYISTNFAENGKPEFGPTALSFRIKDGVVNDNTDVVLGQDGRFLVFHNGTSVFTYRLSEGYQYGFPFISAKDYDAEKRSISYLGIDSETNVITIIVSKKTEDEKTGWKHSSEIFFYSLNEKGTLDLIEHVASEAFPKGVSLSRGSNVAITQNVKISTDKAFVGTAFFIGTDGVPYQVSLEALGGQEGDVEPLSDKALAGVEQDATGEYLSPVQIHYESENRQITAVKQGYTSFIQRPVNFRRRGGIQRPVNITVDQPALALAQLGKKNKVTQQKVFTDGFQDQGGLVGMMAADSGASYLSTRNGKVFALEVNSDVESAGVKLLGQIASDESTIDKMYYFSNRDSFVAINSYVADEKGVITKPGALLVARKRDTGSTLIGSNLTKISWPVSSFCSGLVSSIRRPCNIRSN